MNVDIQTVIDRRNSGEKLVLIAKSLSMPESTLRGRLRRAASGQYHPKPRAAKARIANAVNAAAPVPVVPVSSGTFVPPSWYALLKYAVGSEKGACLFGPRG